MPNSLNAGYVRNVSVSVGAEYTETEVQTEENGIGASTTGNIYGVYDMSGGAYEYVMAYSYNENVEFGGYSDNYGTYNYSGFTNATKPEDKYFDKYISIDRLTACNGQQCYGIGYGETPWWYADLSVDMMFLYDEEYPWVYRGGYSDDGSNAGSFVGVAANGHDSTSRSFRSVLVMTGA